MTNKDYKLAEEYRKSLWQRLTDEDEFERLSMFDENVEEAFLAGLEAGRPKWHKVSDGDLPKKGITVLVMLENGQPDISGVSTDNRWFCTDYYTGEDKVIAWCEIPPYEEI